MRGTFQNCGQNCIGLERLIVQDFIHDRLVAELKTRIESLTVGPPLEDIYDCGAITMSNHVRLFFS